MSAIGAAFGRVVGGLGGPQVAAVIVAGGIVVGAVGGVVTATGGRTTPATISGQLPVYPCPGTGPALVMVEGGQELLVTGRTEDGAWLRIHYPLPGRAEAWVQAAPLSIDGSVADLPVASCIEELAIAPPSLVPVESLTAVVDNLPTPTPTTAPTPTPTPTLTPNTRPSLTGLTVSTRKISYDTGAYCKTAVKKVTVTVKAADDSGLDGVTLFWRKPGAATFAQSAMTRTAGTATRGTWQVTLDTKADGITKAGKLAYYAVARDTSGATRRIPSGGSRSITVAVCVNTGPAITGASSSSGSSLSWDPLGVGSCRTSTSITATVKDVDGVKSVTLFYRPPGSTTWSSKPMTKTGSKWSATFDTGADKVMIPNPPTGSLKWYVKAIDETNKASQTKTRSITIRRCDTEARFDPVPPMSPTYSCSAAAITLRTYADDRDQPEHGLKVVFHWSLANNRNPGTPVVSGKTTADLTKGNYYQGTTKTFTGSLAPSGTLTVYSVTTDKYGGTTTGPTSTYAMRCQ